MPVLREEHRLSQTSSGKTNFQGDTVCISEKKRQVEGRMLSLSFQTDGCHNIQACSEDGRLDDPGKAATAFDTLIPPQALS